MARILVIDDDSVIREMILDILARTDHDVAEASDSTKGVDFFRQNPVDLVITDLFLPPLGGLEVIKQLRKDFPRSRS
jgi:CheY-like chemotaxis protein